jgi:NAD-dependent deacetylase
MNHTSIATAAELVREARQIVALSGAGISKPSGIPDFRSDSGLWQQHNPFEIASLRAFRANPLRFYDWFKPLLSTILAAQPNPAHLALARLEQAHKLKAVVTQNIDGLHQRAGSKEVYELHGHLRSARCLECEREVPLEAVLREVRRGLLPHCTCGGMFKPDVVLFDELLPRGLFWLSQRAVETCDLMIVAGTSLEVAPVCDMPLAALRHGAKLIVINLDATYIDERASVTLHEDVALALPAIVERALS